MSQHPSLRSDRSGGHYRNVLKRWEKIRHLIEKDKWDAEEDSVFHLPKIKRIKLKIKKRKPAAEEEEAPEEAGVEEGVEPELEAETEESSSEEE